LQTKYHDRGLVVLGVNTSDARDVALEYLRENKVNFLNLLDTSGAGDRAMRSYETLAGTSAVPMTYLIDRGGKVVEAWYGFEPGRAEKALHKLGL
jgi:peroxiredoxin